MSTIETDKYAICMDCGQEHVDRAAMNKHMKDSLAPTGEVGVVERGHSQRVVNPTPEEVEASRIRRIVSRAVEDALQEAFDDLDREIDRGRIAEEQVTAEIKGYPDFADGWDEWRADAEADR